MIRLTADARPGSTGKPIRSLPLKDHGMTLV